MSAGGTTKDNNSSACYCSVSLGPSLLLVGTITSHCQSTTFNLTSTQHTCVFNTHTHTHTVYIFCMVSLRLSSFLCSAHCDCLLVCHHRSARSRLLILSSGPLAAESRWANRDSVKGGAWNKAGAELRLGQLFLLVTFQQAGAESRVCAAAD